MHLYVELPIHLFMLLGMAETTAWLVREYRHLADPPKALVPFILTCAALTMEAAVLCARVAVRIWIDDTTMREVNLMLRSAAAFTVLIALCSSWWWRFSNGE